MDKLYETPIKAIRKKCIDCCCGSHKEVKECTVIKCAIYPYRYGRRPDKAIVDTLKEFYGEKGKRSMGFLANRGILVDNLKQL